ncbi:hypothetical protein EGW08_020180 [Elysia chlorotica]|uniref:Cytochrome P450 n=1 Tax=Elysia chlorotica TaxID=188477 RepID=A0A3S0ZPA2_ELYCH|nr:hypothetical protein EGW08_020180 [Elysia chlorotica]
MDVTWLLLGLAVALVLAWLVVRLSAWPVQHILPGLGVDTPPGSRLFGHFFEGIKHGIFDVQTHYYSMFKGKKVYGWNDFKTPTIVLRDLDLIKDVCVKHFGNFTDRRDLVRFEPPFDQNLLTIFGDHWKRVRSAVSPTFTSGRLKKMSRHIERNAKLFQRLLRRKQESIEDIELKEMMSRVTMDTIASTGFGLDIDTVNQPDNDFFKHAQAFINPNIGLFLVSMVVPLLGKLLSSVGVKFISQKSSDFFKNVVEAALRERKESENAGQFNDFLDLVINAEEKEEGDTDEKAKVMRSLSHDEILGQALLFILAGYDTVSSVLAFTLFLLALHPEHQRRVQEELDSKFGDTDLEDWVPDYEGVQSLPYLDQCINEAMRLFPPGILIDRICTEEITMHGVRFPKGMTVILPIYAIHMDPDLWEDPQDFKPERFSPEAREARHQFSFFPFGHGPRNCIGLRLALLELKMVLASVLRSFDVTPCGKTVFPVRLSSWQLVAKDGLWVKLDRRGHN